MVHEELMRKILEAIRGLEVVSVVHVKRHQVGMQFWTRGNNLADRQTKKAALLMVNIPDVRGDKTQEYPSCPSSKEIEGYEKIGRRWEEGKWRLPDGREL